MQMTLFSLNFAIRKPLKPNLPHRFNLKACLSSDQQKVSLHFKQAWAHALPEDTENIQTSKPNKEESLALCHSTVVCRPYWKHVEYLYIHMPNTSWNIIYRFVVSDQQNCELSLLFLPVRSDLNCVFVSTFVHCRAHLAERRSQQTPQKLALTQDEDSSSTISVSNK